MSVKSLPSRYTPLHCRIWKAPSSSAESLLNREHIRHVTGGSRTLGSPASISDTPPGISIDSRIGTAPRERASVAAKRSDNRTLNSRRKDSSAAACIFLPSKPNVTETPPSFCVRLLFSCTLHIDCNRSLARC